MSLFTENDPALNEEILDYKKPEHLEEIIKILMKSSSNRTRIDLRHLYRILMTIPFFKMWCKEMPDDLRGGLLRELKYKYAGKGQKVVQAGDAEYNFTFILKGSINFLIPPKQNEKIQTVLPNHRPSISTHFNTVRNMIEPKSHEHVGTENKINTSRDVESTEEQLAWYKNYKVLKIRHTGEYYGEKAVQFSSSSLVTGVCHESCHLMTLSFSIYNKILKLFQRRAQQDTYDFFKLVPLTCNWSSDALNELLQNLQKHSFQRKQLIYEVGSTVSSIYFIRSGEVEITKETEISVTEEQFFTKAVKIPTTTDLEKSKLVDMNAIWKNKLNLAQKQRIKMAIIGAQQSFGEEEVFAKSPKRKSKAIVYSSIVELFSVSVEKFLEIHRIQMEIGNNQSHGAKDKWRKNFEHQIVEMNQVQEEKAQQCKNTPQKIDLTTIPMQFIKKEDKIPGTKPPKHVRSNSSSNLLPTKKTNTQQPVQSPDSAHLFNGIPINPLLRRIKTPRGDGKRTPPKTRNFSPPPEFVTARPTIGTIGETSNNNKTLRIRLSSANPQNRAVLEHLSKLNLPSRKASIHQSVENTPTSLGSPFNKSNYISFVQKIASAETSRPKSNHYERVKILSIKESGSQKTPGLSSRGETPSLFKGWKEDDGHDLTGSKIESMKSHRKNSGHSISQSRIGMGSIALPLSVVKQAPYFPSTVLAKGELKTVQSLFGTPTGSKAATGGTKSFTQMALKASIASAANSPRESQVFSSRASFGGRLLHSKSFKGKF